jgi:NitT/TauT family transport system substrate-binding protein
MHIMQSRRDFLATMSAAGAASVFGARGSIADEGPPETTTVRLSFLDGDLHRPTLRGRRFLRAEGFMGDVHYVRAAGGFSTTQQIAEGEVDFGASFAGSVVSHLDAGFPLTALGGLHTGCYELLCTRRFAASAT